VIHWENDWIAVSISEANGSITSFYDKQKQLEFVASGYKSDPFRIELSEGYTSEFQSFTHEPDLSEPGRQGWIFTWVVKPGLRVIGKVLLYDNENEVRFYNEVDNQSEDKVVCLEYPIIPNLQTITDQGERDYVAHSFATGFRIHNPMKHLDGDELGFRFMPYPEGFSGSTMQFFTYYGLNRSGLYFAALDGEGYAKWLNFYKNGNGLLEASIIHGCEDIGPRKGIKTSYPVVVKLLEGLDWYEAADIYKAWAERQFWCAKGNLADVSEHHKSVWLLEQMGVATFGINAGLDRTLWLKEFHKYIESPIFHILGPDWVHKTQSFYNGIPGGMDDWFPTRFDQANLQCMKTYGDKYAPFEFDYLFNVNGADGERGLKALQKFPENLKSMDKYKFPLICPFDSYVRELHVRRDKTLQLNVDVDSIYYDISANNILKACTDESHGHTVGAGQQINNAYRDNYIRTKQAMIEQAGQYIPMGTEMINEMFLDVLDYYQARAGGQPAAPLEGWNLRELLKSGEAELIPMFTYVYHEYGALRVDGWGKLVEEIGTLYYFAVARTYLWGGLYELNYEYSPMEAINGVENPAEEHYYIYEQRGYAFSPERAHYLNDFAKLRTGIGNKYLAYGRMLRPLEFKREKVALDWFLYNCDKNFKEYNDSGTLTVDAIVHSAWQYRNESVGLFFANVTEAGQKVALKIDKRQFDTKVSKCVIRKPEEDSIAGHLDLLNDVIFEIEFTIPKKSVVLVELLS
jgi:hypothetical protein